MLRRNASVFTLMLSAALLLAACGGSSTGPTAASSAGNTGSSSHDASRSQNSVPQPAQPNQPPAPAPEAGGGDTTGALGASSSAAGGATTGSAADGSTSGGAGASAADGKPESNQASKPRAGREREKQDEPYDSTFYQNYGVNPFVHADDDPFSTFAMDIDTASYGVMRRYLSDGNLPNADSVRVEEYLNYFNYRYPKPDDGGNFAIYTEAAPSPFGGKNYEMLQIGIQGRVIAEEARKPTSLTFVIDVSGSMAEENRLGTVKRALAILVKQLRAEDKIGIVAYGSDARVVLAPTSGANTRRILNAIDELAPSGSTNVEAGLDIGFPQAQEAFVRGSNMILLCSDGVANNGVTDPQALVEKYKQYTSTGIKLATFGFGMGNYNDVLMEQLADAGNGFYTYIDTLDEAERVFAQNLTGTLQLIARDAKIQVEFNPEVVSRYRLVGYENRAVADQNFRNDSVDAGEVGAGHSVTALYEIKRVPDAQGEIATVRIRYHRPDNTRVVEEQQTISASERRDFDDATPRFRFAVSVAEYAELLRHSRWTRGAVLDHVVEMARDASRDFEDDAEVTEFVALLKQAARLAPDE